MSGKWSFSRFADLSKPENALGLKNLVEALAVAGVIGEGRMSLECLIGKHLKACPREMTCCCCCHEADFNSGTSLRK